MSNVGNYFGPLKCNSCGKIINEIAYSESGDEEHIYCRKCWAVMENEETHRRECERIKAECVKTSNRDVKAECFKALKRLRCSSEYYKGCGERKTE